MINAGSIMGKAKHLLPLYKSVLELSENCGLHDDQALINAFIVDNPTAINYAIDLTRYHFSQSEQHGFDICKRKP